MIPVANIGRQSEAWQLTLRSAIRDSGELLARLGLAAHPLAAEIDRAADFATLVPEPFLRRMRPGDADDPLLLQVLALRSERLHSDGYSADPLVEASFGRAPGLLQKYTGRALLLAAGACAVHCRYCFRRHFPYAEHAGAQALPEPTLAAIAADPQLSEIILSGGDPLMLRDSILAELIERLGAIPQLQRLRIHTRLPVVIPARVTDALVAMLANSRLTCVVVVHVNHPAELDDEVAAALSEFRRAGIVLLNQSVLLHAVNDEVEVLARLSERLFELGVLPYYLHMLDLVAGAERFAVDIDRARQLLAELRGRLPGYLVPRLVQELAFADAKTPVI